MDVPPTDPVEGQCWLLGPAPSAAWSGHVGELASYQAGNWLFAPPRDGLRLLDRTTGQLHLYLGRWRIAAEPPEPAGGSTVDAEARAAIASLTSALRTAGILPDV